MSSLKRILASRANGALSRGPKTAAGKARAGQNALRHGLLANCVLVKGESHEGLESLLAAFLDRFAPSSDVEFGLVEEMVAAAWRQRRAWAIEKRLMDEAISNAEAGGGISGIASAFTALASQPQLHLVHRYETRLHRIFQRALYNLMLLRLEDPRGAQELPNEPSKLLETNEGQNSGEVIDIGPHQ